MLRKDQSLDEILSQLQPLKAEWQDDVAHRVVGRLRALPVKPIYDESDLLALVMDGKANNKLQSKDLDDALLIIRSFLGLSSDAFKGVAADAFGAGGFGLKRFKSDPDEYIAKLVDLGVLEAMMTEVNRPTHWTDTLIERLRSGRGSAISGQKRGRAAEDFAEDIIRKVFGSGGYETRATFVGKNNRSAKCDFAVPSKTSPRVVIESKGFAATGSKMTDVLGDVGKIIEAKRADTTLLMFTDGLTWRARQSDLRKLINYQNQGDITRIYTQAMAQEFEADLVTLRDECGLPQPSKEGERSPR